MLTGRFEGIQGEGTLTKPTTLQSAADSFRVGYTTPFMILPGLGKEKRQDMVNHIQALEIKLNQPDIGLGQQSLNWAANFVGSILNPISLMTGEIAGVGANAAIRSGAGLVGRFAPAPAVIATQAVAQKTIGKAGTTLPNFIGKETIGGLSQKAVSGFSMATGFSLPAELAAHYDEKSDHFNWWGGVKSSFADGGVGLALMSVPYLAGTLWGKLFRNATREAKAPELPSYGYLKHLTPEQQESHELFNRIGKAQAEGNFTANEAKWMKNYLVSSENKVLLEDHAVELLNRSGHPVDAATKRVSFNILSPEDVRNIQVAFADKLASSVPEDIKNNLLHFITHNSGDNIRLKTHMQDGIEGVVKFLQQRVEKIPEEKLAFQKMVKKFLPKNVKEKLPHTQSKLYSALKKGAETDLHIPHQVEKRLRQENKINQLKEVNKRYQKKLEQRANPILENKLKLNEEKIKNLESTLQPLLKHKDEIDYLRNALIKEGEIIPHFKSRRSYHRLLDLTHTSNKARQLMHEVHLLDEYEKQQMYATVLDSLHKMMKSDVGILAKPERVINYMKERLHEKIPEYQKIEKKETMLDKFNVAEREKREIGEVKNEKNEGEKYSPILKKFDEEMKSSPPEIKEEYEKVKTQFNEFNQSENVFKNLISCVVGSLNGAI